jgi:hypothetical protein
MIPITSNGKMSSILTRCMMFKITSDFGILGPITWYNTKNVAGPLTGQPFIGPATNFGSTRIGRLLMYGATAGQATNGVIINKPEWKITL